MYAKTTTIVNKLGLHARPGSFFVREAKQFTCDITVTKLDPEGGRVKSCPAKSIALIMTMMLTQGTRIEISAEGEDEKTAVDTLAALVDGLNET